MKTSEEREGPFGCVQAESRVDYRERGTPAGQAVLSMDDKQAFNYSPISVSFSIIIHVWLPFKAASALGLSVLIRAIAQKLLKQVTVSDFTNRSGAGIRNNYLCLFCLPWFSLKVMDPIAIQNPEMCIS